MPDSEQRNSFRFRNDRERLKLKAHASKLPYKEALRLKGPIYDVLISELIAEGCMTTAKYFQCLVDKEQTLLHRRSITITVNENTDLLYALFEHFKLAEISARLVKNKCSAATVKCFYQGLLIAERAGPTFEWLSEHLYTIVVKVLYQFKMDEPVNNEIKMRIYYRYGCLLAKNSTKLSSAIKYLEMALNIAIGQNWIPDTDDEILKFETMHEATACTLANNLMQYGNLVFNVNEQQAIGLANKAIATLKTTDFERNKLQITQAYLTKIKYILDMKNPKEALKEIKKIEVLIETEEKDDFQYLKCQYYLYKGRAYYHLEFDDDSMECLKKAYSISYIYGLRALEAEIQLHMANVHACDPDEQDYAQAAYESAKMIFIELDDTNNIKKVNYLKAKTKAAQMFPKFLESMKSNDYCKRFELLRWKTRCVPFWCSEELERQERKWSMYLKNELKKESKMSASRSKESGPTGSESDFVSAASFKSITSGIDLRRSDIRKQRLTAEKSIMTEQVKDKVVEKPYEDNKDKIEGEEPKEELKEGLKETVSFAIFEKQVKEVVKEEIQFADSSIDISRRRYMENVIPSYIEKIDRKRRMPDYKKWLQLSVMKRKSTPKPLECLMHEYSKKLSRSH